MTMTKSQRNRFPTNAKTQQVAKIIRMVFRVILEFNAIVEALNTMKRLKDVWYFINNIKEGNDFGNVKPSLCPSVYRGSNDVKHCNRSISPPAQKMKDVARIVIYASLHDNDYIQVLTTNIRINLARCRSSNGGLDTLTCLPHSATRTSETWGIGPAQKMVDVIRMVNYLKLHDKLYIQKVVTNTRVNCARKQWSISSRNISASSSVPGIANVSTANMADVIKASSICPNWGMKKRCRVVSLTK
ncbi:uncharacterized protein LOC143078359 [Mytilus galloprovincialis]|uniref:uncharacterized protein LOC143078359 n=1 Tax=Mytilus galloprovincialis TaxID=29158 RepID=UPI003F7BDCB2